MSGSRYGDALPQGLDLPPVDRNANDYSRIESMVGSVEPTLPISVVLPVYNRIDMLRRTMAMLTHQTYPLHLMEVIIADDGSNDQPEQLIEEFSEFFEVNYVRQRDLGYRLSHVRNLGVRSARHDHVIILDCDMAPVPDLVRIYASWLALDEKVLLIGHRRYVDANDIPPESVLADPRVMLELPNVETKNAVMKNSPSKDWREPIYAETDMLKQADHPFRVSSCGNVAFHRRIFSEAGPFDEDFTDWGAEDNEFGYRVWNAGYWFVPLVEAMGMHQEPPGGREFVDREAGKAVTRPMLLDKVPSYYRAYDPEAHPTVPLVSVYIPAYNASTTIESSIQSALRQTYADLEIVVCDDGSTDDTLEILHRLYGDHPKVRILHQPNAGIGAASNAAIAAARGTFIVQLDSDDLLEADAVETLLSYIENERELGCVYGRHYMFSGDISNRREAWFQEGFSRSRLLHGMIVHPPRMFRKRDWSRVNGFDEALSNAVDYDFFLRLSNITTILSVEDLLYNYRIHDTSTSVRQRGVQTENTKRVQRKYLEASGLGSWDLRRDHRFQSERAITFFEKPAGHEQTSDAVDVSIVMITRNRSHLIGDAIRSCLLQTVQSFELLVVDDGSEDDTEETVKSFGDQRIRYVRQEHLGIPSARNRGVLESKGEWVVIMDDDDLMLPNRLEDHLAAVGDDVSGSFGGWIDIDEKSIEHWPGKSHGFSQLLQGGKVLIHGGSMIRRSVLLEYPYDTTFDFGTDFLMNLQISEAGHKLNHTGSYVLLRRFHGENVTLTNTCEQRNTSRVKVDEMREAMEPSVLERHKEIAKGNREHPIEFKPAIEDLARMFPWIESVSTLAQQTQGTRQNQSMEAVNSSQTVGDSYAIHRQRWVQQGSVLSFDALTRTVHFHMPPNWSLERTHDDLLRLAHFVLNSPFEDGILEGWVPTRKQGSRPGLAFSGGVDSTAAMMLMPPETVLIYNERIGLKSILDHTNALRFIDELAKHGRPVLRVQSDHEGIRLDHGKPAGFSTDLAGAVQVILLADYFDLGYLAMGMPLENAYLFHGHTGRDFIQTRFWKFHSKIFSKAGLELYYPVAGLSEFANQRLVESEEIGRYAQSCLRSNQSGEVCGQCWKCFRKNSMRGRDIRLEGETLSFLGKRPLKQAASTLYAIQRLPEEQQQQITSLHEDLGELLGADYGFLDRFHPGALLLVPERYRSRTESKIRALIDQMTDVEQEQLLSMDLKTQVRQQA
jgi:chondroitin synthase